MQPPHKLPRLDGVFDQSAMPQMGTMPQMTMLGANSLGAGALGLGALGTAIPGMPSMPGLGGLPPMPGMPTGMPGMPPMPGMPGMPGMPPPPGMPGSFPGGLPGGIPGMPSMGGAPSMPGIPSLPGGMPGGMPAMPGMSGMPGMPGMQPPAVGAGRGAMGGMMPGLVYANMAAAAAMTLASMGQDDSDSSDEDEEEEAPAAFDKDMLARLAQRAAEVQAEPEPVAALQPSAAAAMLAAATAQPGMLGASPGVGLYEPEAPVDIGTDASRLLGQSAAVAEPGQEASDSDSDPNAHGVSLGMQASGAAAWSAATVASARAVGPVETEKKDASSVASLLQQVQSNVARGRAGGGSKKSETSMQQAFGFEPSNSPPAGGGALPPSSAALEAIYQRVESVSSSSSDACRALERDVLDVLPSLEPARAADLVVRVHGAESLRSAEFLADVSQAITAFVPKLGSPHLARVMGTVANWAVAASGGSEDSPAANVRLSEEVRGFFTAAAKEASGRLMDVVPGDLARIASSLASMGLAEPWLFGSLARAAAARSERFSSQEITSLAGAFDKAGLVHTSLFESLARILRNGFKDLSYRELLVGMRALATGGVRDKELGNSVSTHLLKGAEKGELPAEEFCSLAWTFCALDLYQDKMFRAVFRALEDAAVVSSETLCQLYEIHVTLKAFHFEAYKEYMLEADTVQGLCDHYKKHRGGQKWVAKPEKASEKVLKDIAEALKDVLGGSTVHRQHQTELGFSVDTAALRKKNASAVVMLDVDGPLSLMRSLDPADARQAGGACRVRGSVIMKRRVLQKNGFRICVMTEDIWRALEDSKEKRDFLREMLKTAGVTPARLR